VILKKPYLDLILKKDWRAWVVLKPEKDFGLLRRRPG